MGELPPTAPKAFGEGGGTTIRAEGTGEAEGLHWRLYSLLLGGRKAAENKQEQKRWANSLLLLTRISCTPS